MFTLSGNKCFHVSTVKETYANAVTACKDMGAELAKISSPADDEIVSALRRRDDSSGGVFIGLNNNQGSWAWQDGSSLTSYTNWITWPDEKQEPQGPSSCVVKYFNDLQNYGGWTSLHNAPGCDAQKKYACSNAAEDRTGCTYSCSDPRFALLGDKCFNVSPADVKVNYNDAANACQGMNAHLAKISSLG